MDKQRIDINPYRESEWERKAPQLAKWWTLGDHSKHATARKMRAIAKRKKNRKK